MERITRFVILLAFRDGVATADGARQAITSALESLPQALRRTLTWDQGKELAMHQQITCRHRGALRRRAFPVTAWQQREHERAAARLLPEGEPTSASTPPRTSPESLRRSTTALARHSAANAQSICSTPRSRGRRVTDPLRPGEHAMRLGPPGLSPDRIAGPAHSSSGVLWLLGSGRSCHPTLAGFPPVAVEWGQMRPSFLNVRIRKIQTSLVIKRKILQLLD